MDFFERIGTFPDAGFQCGFHIREYKYRIECGSYCKPMSFAVVAECLRLCCSKFNRVAERGVARRVGKIFGIGWAMEEILRKNSVLM